MDKAFIAIYSGRTVASARLIAVTSEPELVREVAGRVLASGAYDAAGCESVSALNRGRRAALRAVSREAPANGARR